MRRATGECAWFLKPIHNTTELQLPLRAFLNEARFLRELGALVGNGPRCGVYHCLLGNTMRKKCWTSVTQSRSCRFLCKWLKCPNLSFGLSIFGLVIASPEY